MNDYQLENRPSDVASLYIVDYIKSSLDELAADTGRITNIFTLLFHHLVVHFTGIVILRECSENYDSHIIFPWINSQYAKSPYLLNSTNFEREHKEVSFYTAVREFQLIPLEVGASIPFGYKQDRILDKCLKLVSGYSVRSVAYLPRYKYQIERLNHLIEHLCEYFTIENVDSILRNWSTHVEQHVVEGSPKVHAKSLIIGTRNDFENRKKSINYLALGKDVVGITHGEISNSVYDEPVYGYSDLSLCRTLVDYGNYRESGEINTPLVYPKRSLQRSSKVIKNIYQPSDQICAMDIQDSRVLYVPTMYQDNCVYGPFHGYSNKEYRRWQEAIIESVPNVVDKNHPKSRSRFRLSYNEENRRMEECVGDYDVYIIDYVATGAVLSLFSSAPVIYFDIGLRRLSNTFSSDLRERCVTVSIDISSNLKEQIKNGLETYRNSAGQWSNVQLAKYSIANPTTYGSLSTIRDLWALVCVTSYRVPQC